MSKGERAATGKKKKAAQKRLAAKKKRIAEKINKTKKAKAQKSEVSNPVFKKRKPYGKMIPPVAEAQQKFKELIKKLPVGAMKVSIDSVEQQRAIIDRFMDEVIAKNRDMLDAKMAICRTS